MAETGESEGSCCEWRFGTVVFNEAQWLVTVNGAPVELERKPAMVLNVLLQHAGEVVTKDELLDQVWDGRVVVEGALTNAIGKLRRALADNASALKTVPRVGYRIEAQVECRRLDKGAAHDTVLQVGRRVPRRSNWLLRNNLAMGGVAETWLAEHAKTGEQRVFKFALDSIQLRALRREVAVGRLLAASFAGSNDFVQPLDWDFQEQPFYVEFPFMGERLDHWASRRLDDLKLAERLELLARLAETVANAHDVGVLHKDLKPANVLVVEKEGELTLRITDFGSSWLTRLDAIDALAISRSVFSEAELASGESASGGTAGYIAPELLAGQSASTRSDVYSLGVMLYQLIAGDLSKVMATGWEADVSDPLLIKDVAQATRGDPEQRLTSARELAERLRSLDARRELRERQRANEERQQTLERATERMRARRPWLITAAVSLIAGTLVATWQFLEAIDARDEARSQFRVVNEVARFVSEGVLEQASPQLSKNGYELSVMDAVRNAAPQIEQRFADRPDVAAALHETLGKVLHHLGSSRDAAYHYERMLEKLDGGASMDPDKVAGVLLEYANTLATAGRMDDAEQVLSSRGLGEPSNLGNALRARRHAVQAVIALNRGQGADALRHLEEAVALNPEDQARDLIPLAMIRAGRFEEAFPVQKAVLAEKRRRLGPRHPQVVNLESYFLGAWLESEHPASWLRETQELIEAARESLGAESHVTARAHHLHALSQLRVGDHSVALVHFEQAFDILRHIRVDPSIVQALQYDWVAALRDMGRPSDADSVEARMESLLARLSD